MESFRNISGLTELHAKTARPLIEWQVPAGNQYYLTENNTDGHRTTGRRSSSPIQPRCRPPASRRSFSGPATPDDGGFLRIFVGRFYANRPWVLGRVAPPVAPKSPPRGRELYNWLPMGRDLTLRLTTDRPGELARVAQTLSSSGVNIEGIAQIEGVVHILARDPSAARSALRAAGYTMDGELEVLVLPMTDRPGELSMIMQRLADASVNLRFIYLATETRVVIGVDDITRARALLESSQN
ncbi:MAG: hypothetical protein M3024_00850 [Candidatus Dormibacteraeota bacterium]|nr:hypothetical protein [Candidatus Dormibacteraeota bacterium]